MQKIYLKNSLLCAGIMVANLSPAFCGVKCPSLSPNELAAICTTGSFIREGVTLRNFKENSPMNCDAAYGTKVKVWGKISKSKYDGVRSDEEGAPDDHGLYCKYDKKTLLGKVLLFGLIFDDKTFGENNTEKRKWFDSRHRTAADFTKNNQYDPKGAFTAKDKSLAFSDPETVK